MFQAGRPGGRARPGRLVDGVRQRVLGTPRLVWAGLAIVLAQALVRVWALSGSWFYFDDLAFMSRAMQGPMTASYLTESYGGHLMPAGFALTWLLTHWAAWTWWPWAAVLVILQAVASTGMLRLLRSMFGDTPVVLALLALYVSLVFTLSAGIWYAAGINQLPLQIALVFGLHAHLAYLRTRRWQHLVATLAWTAFGLVFYEKTLVVFGLYALLALCWFATGNTPERLTQLWTRYRTGVVAHAVLVAGYGGLYAAYGLTFSPATAGSQSLTPLAWNLAGVAASAGVVGGPLAWRPLDVGSFADPSQLLLVVAWVAVGGLAYHAYQTRTVSLRAWSLLGFTLTANLVLLASARANIVGPDIGLEYRYQTETAAVFVLGLGLAFLPLRGAVVRNEVRPGAVRTYEAPRIVAAATACVVVAALVSTGRYVSLWQDRNPTESYYGQVSSTLARAAAERRGPVPLVDLGIPQTMLWAYRYPENTYSHVFRNLRGKATYPATAVDNLYLFDDAGRLRPVDVPPTRRMLPTGGCGYALGGGPVRIPLDGPVIGGGWWIRLGYAGQDRSSVRVRAGDDTHDLTLPPGLHNVFLTASGRFDAVTLSGPRGVCVTDLVLGIPQAQEPAA